MPPLKTIHILAHHLRYEPRQGADSVDSVLTPIQILKIPVGTVDPELQPEICQALEDGVLTIKSSLSSKSIFAGMRYEMVRPIDQGLAIHNFTVESLADVKSKLEEGWKICKRTPSIGLLDILTPADAAHLSESIDMSLRWREVVAAIFNQEIQSTCNWTVGGAFTAALESVVKDVDIEATAGNNFYAAGATVSARDYVCTYVSRMLETHISAIFDFIKDDRDAFYFAHPTALGVDVCKYTDVRAIIWHMHNERVRAEHEQAIEDGLAR